MTDTDRLAHNASIPADLAALVVLAATRLDVPLRAFRSSSRRRDYLAERRRIIATARRYGFTWMAIGRALNRDHSTCIQVMKGRA